MTNETRSKVGRPPKPDAERRIQRSIRLLPTHWEKIDTAGKAEFEQLLERWQPPEKKSTK